MPLMAIIVLQRLNRTTTGTLTPMINTTPTRMTSTRVMATRQMPIITSQTRGATNTSLQQSQ